MDKEEGQLGAHSLQSLGQPKDHSSAPNEFPIPGKARALSQYRFGRDESHSTKSQKGRDEYIRSDRSRSDRLQGVRPRDESKRPYRPRDDPSRDEHNRSDRTRYERNREDRSRDKRLRDGCNRDDRFHVERGQSREATTRAEPTCTKRGRNERLTILAKRPLEDDTRDERASRRPRTFKTLHDSRRTDEVVPITTPEGGSYRTSSTAYTTNRHSTSSTKQLDLPKKELRPDDLVQPHDRTIYPFPAPHDTPHASSPSTPESNLARTRLSHVRDSPPSLFSCLIGSLTLLPCIVVQYTP